LKHISRTYFLITVVLIVMTLLFEGIFHFIIDFNTEKHQIKSTIEQMVGMVEEPAAQASYNIDVELAQKVVEGLVEYRYNAEAQIINDFGDIIGSASSEVPDEGINYQKGIQISENNTISAALSTPDSKLRVGSLILRVNGRFLTNDLMGRLALKIGFLLFWDLILILILTAVFYYWLVRPILQITTNILFLDVENPGGKALPVPRSHTNDELGQLVVTINRVLSDLSDYMTMLKNNEQQIKNSLKEKEVLLQEIHHRVKNNLQIISSLLNLQTSTVEEPQIKKAITESQNRISAMSLVHEELYNSDNLSNINFTVYLQKLSAKLSNIYAADTSVSIIVDMPNIFLDVSTTIVCGLIANELISNALKYAFTDRDQGTIELITAERNGVIEFSVSDDGVGLPEDLKKRSQTSLGLRLVEGLVGQIQGSFTIADSDGTRFIIQFPYSTIEKDHFS
jgi:two-component sensor histidine kinase